jgi:hypothetical protein
MRLLLIGFALGLASAAGVERARKRLDEAIDREPTHSPGRWLVVVDSEHTARPQWAVPRPARKE